MIAVGSVKKTFQKFVEGREYIFEILLCTGEEDLPFTFWLLEEKKMM